MSKKITTTQQRPALVFRVGITGARCLQQNQRERISMELHTALALVSGQLSELTHQEHVSLFYQQARSGHITPIVRLVSSLARGADRLGAAAAYALGMPVDVPMPFPQAIYEADFQGSESKCPGEEALTPEQDLAEFRELLSQSSGKVMLDGGRNSDSWIGGDLLEQQSYEAVGRYVVRHCDLLLAVWDGSASAGKGGTQEIVEYATRVGVPVWWIHAGKNTPPRWLTDQLDIQSVPKHESSAAERLALHIRRLIPAPAKPSHAHRTALVTLATCWQKPKSSPALEYFEQQRLPKRWIWELHTLLMKIFGWRLRPVGSKEKTSREQRSTPATAAGNEEPAYWFRLYEEADSRAGDFIVRYRSSYILVILLAALSLIVGELADVTVPPLAERFRWLAALPTVVLLALAASVLLVSVRQDWHLKSVEYRLLAELFRKQKTLATLGWALAISGVEHLADSENLSWIAWLLAASQRASPFPYCITDARGLSVLRVDELEHLLQEQIEYHRQREEISERVAGNLERVGGIAFLGLFTVSILSVWALASERHNLAVILTLLTGILPSVSAAFLAIRSYAELDLIAEQSRSMVADLSRAKRRLERLETRRPLASQVLGAEAAVVATVMLQELDGWGRVFRGKLLETP